MDGCVKQPLPPAFRGLPVARVFVDVWDEPRVEDSFAVMPGIKPAIEVEIRAVDFQIRESGHALEGVQSLWQEYGIRLIRRRHGKRSQHVAVVVHDRDDLLTRLMFVAGIADAIPALFGDGVGAVLMPPLISVERCIVKKNRETCSGFPKRLEIASQAFE